MSAENTEKEPQQDQGQTQAAGHELEDTRGDGKVTVKKRKKRKKHLFKLSAMNELVQQDSYLKNQYEKLKVNGEERLGYHWNEVVQNIIFNKFVKHDKVLMARYLNIKRSIELKGDEKKKNSTKHHRPTKKEVEPEKPQEAPAQTDPQTNPAPAAPAAPVNPNAPIDTRLMESASIPMTANSDIIKWLLS